MEADEVDSFSTGQRMCVGYALKPAMEWYESLEAPPATNDADWREAATSLHDIPYGHPPNDRFYFRCKNKWEIVRERIPAFLAEHDERAAERWRQLVGLWSPEVPTLRLGGTEYRLDGDPSPWFLQGQAVEELAAGIDEALPAYSSFNRTLTEEYDEYAVEDHPLLEVRGLCIAAGSDGVVAFGHEGAW